MTNHDLLILGDLLKQEINNIKQLKGAKLSYYITLNIDIINEKIQQILQTITPNNDYLEYEQTRIDICEKYCKRDENGNLIKIQIDENKFEYDVDINNPDWNIAMNNLKTKYSNTIEYRNNQITAYNKLLQQECDIDLNMFTLDIISDDVTVELMSILKFFIIK